jgi:hypothetical protein
VKLLKKELKKEKFFMVAINGQIAILLSGISQLTKNVRSVALY